MRLRQIKKEIRIIGIAARSDTGSIQVIGAVFRGSQWLDGVLKTRSTTTDITVPIVEMIKGSPHYGQLRILLLSRASLPQETKFSINKISYDLEKPVIVIGDGKKTSYIWRKNYKKKVFSSAGINRWSAERVLNISTREGDIPEALRIADLILSALPRESNT